MKIEYLGHSCYYIEFQNGIKILVDPLLTETFQDDTAEVWPPRKINLSAFPQPDAIVITHCHPGHLEIPSLALLNKNVPVYHPEDGAVSLTLEEMGFVNANIVEHGDTIDLGESKCIFTGSVSDINEMGVLFVEGENSFWFQADSETSDRIANDVRKWVNGKLTLLIGSYAAYNNKFFTHFRFDFPYEDVAFFVEQVMKLEPEMVAPNFIGFRYIGSGEWINRYMFPTTPDQFLRDVAKFSTKIEKFLNITPGTSIILENKKREITPNNVSYILSTQAPKISVGLFDPLAEIPALKDPDVSTVGVEELRKRMMHLLNDKFLPWLKESIEDDLDPIRAYAMLGVKFRLHIHYPKDLEEIYFLDMGNLSAGLVREAEPQSYADVTMRAAASVLDLWQTGDIPYYRAYHHVRAHSRIYRLMLSLDRRVEAAMIDGREDTKTRIAMDGRDPLSIYFNHDITLHYYPWLRKKIKQYS